MLCRIWRENNCFGFLSGAVAESKAAHRIVVTHHVPSFRMLCPKHIGNRINGAFTVELEDYIKDSGIEYWIYGHSHYNIDVQIGQTKCVSNQLGYVFADEHRYFVPDKVIELI